MFDFRIETRNTFLDKQWKGDGHIRLDVNNISHFLGNNFNVEIQNIIIYHAKRLKNDSKLEDGYIFMVDHKTLMNNLTQFRLWRVKDDK